MVPEDADESEGFVAADVRSDAEVVCGFMEPVVGFRGMDYPKSLNGWWLAELGAKKEPSELTLDRLREVEAKLTDEQWKDYCAAFAVQNLPQPSEGDTFADTVAWDRAHLHASPFVKIRALAAVLRDRGSE